MDFSSFVSVILINSICLRFRCSQISCESDSYYFSSKAGYRVLTVQEKNCLSLICPDSYSHHFRSSL